jgi:hypothetical protein
MLLDATMTTRTLLPDSTQDYRIQKGYVVARLSRWVVDAVCSDKHGGVTIIEALLQPGARTAK